MDITNYALGKRAFPFNLRAIYPLVQLQVARFKPVFDRTMRCCIMVKTSAGGLPSLA